MYNRLKEVLEEKGITPYKLAGMSNIGRPDLYNALNGFRPMYPGWKKRIAEALEMSEAELFVDERPGACHENENNRNSIPGN